MQRPEPVVPDPGQESVWDYPRPPRVETVPERLRVVVDGEVLADTTAGLRVLETAGAPVYYFPRGDVLEGWLAPSPHTSVCEWKGVADYRPYGGPDGRVIDNVAWSYPDPSPGYEAIRGYVAFYAGRVDEAWGGGARRAPPTRRGHGR